MRQVTAGRSTKIVGCLVLIAAGCGETARPTTTDLGLGKKPETQKTSSVDLGKLIAGNIDLRAKLKEPPEDVSNLPTAFSLTAGEVLKDWQEGQNVFLRKYYGKVLEVNGTVTGVGWRSYMGPFIALKSDDATKQSVMCVIADPEPWAKVLPGQQTKVKGKCYEPFMGPTLLYATVLEANKYPGIALTAQQLADEYANDKEATGKKYDGKWLVLSGEVVERQSGEFGVVNVFLKTAEKVRVQCRFNGTEDKLADLMPKSGQAYVVVEFDESRNSPDLIVFYGCLPLKNKGK
jgi:hypothetical protein